LEKRNYLSIGLSVKDVCDPYRYIFIVMTSSIAGLLLRCGGGVELGMGEDSGGEVGKVDVCDNEELRTSSFCRET
jgi:hypothetical protein